MTFAVVSFGLTTLSMPRSSMTSSVLSRLTLTMTFFAPRRAPYMPVMMFSSSRSVRQISAPHSPTFSESSTS